MKPAIISGLGFGVFVVAVTLWIQHNSVSVLPQGGDSPAAVFLSQTESEKDSVTDTDTTSESILIEPPVTTELPIAVVTATEGTLLSADTTDLTSIQSILESLTAVVAVLVERASSGSTLTYTTNNPDAVDRDFVHTQADRIYDTLGDRIDDVADSVGDTEIDSSMLTDVFTQDGNAFAETALLGTTDAHSLAFITDDTTRMIITEAGNVGIGTTSPASVLDVWGNFRVGTSSTPTLYVDTATRRVGIGTSTPQSTFHAVGQFRFDGHQTITHSEAPSNTRFGSGAGNFLTASAAGNVYFGYTAGFSTDTGNNNTGIGFNALQGNTSGSSNVAFGRNALFTANLASNNTALGMSALFSVRGSENVAIGVQAGSLLSSGSANASSSNSIFIGNNTRSGAASSTNEIVVGYGATGLGSNTVTMGSTSVLTTVLRGDVGIGTTTPRADLHVEGFGGIMTSVGTDALAFYSNGNGSVEINATTPNFSGLRELFIGANEFNVYTGPTDWSSSAIRFTITEGGNIGIGTTSPASVLDVWGGFRVGTSSTPTLYVDTSTGRVGVGTSTPTAPLDIIGQIKLDGQSVVTYRPDAFNMRFGQGSGNGLTSTSAGGSNSYNTFFGYTSGFALSDGSENTAVGHNALNGVSQGSGNAAFGRNALGLAGPSSNNVAVGSHALLQIRASNNVAVGTSAGRLVNPSTSNASSTDSVFLGYSTKSGIASSTNEIVIGANAIGLGSNSVVLGNTSIATTSLQGFVGIGTTTPTQKLVVDGNAQFTGVTSGAFAAELNLTADGTLTTSASDRALKTDEVLLDTEDMLAKLLELQPKSFVWKSTNTTDIGLIAQEVELVFPEIVFTNPVDGYKGINYSRLPALIIAALQEIAAQIASLFEKDTVQDDRIEALEERIRFLEAQQDIPEREQTPEENEQENIVVDEEPTETPVDSEEETEEILPTEESEDVPEEPIETPEPEEEMEVETEPEPETPIDPEPPLEEAPEEPVVETE